MIEISIKSLSMRSYG